MFFLNTTHRNGSIESNVHNGLPDIIIVETRAIQMRCVYHCNQVFNKVQIGVAFTVIKLIGVAIVHLNVQSKKNLSKVRAMLVVCWG